MSRGKGLNALKQRFAEMNEQVEMAEERTSVAKAKLIEKQDLHLARETEAKSLKNRIAQLQSELRKAQDKQNESVSKLDDNDMRSKQSEDNRKKLQDKEDEGFESLRELEFAVKDIALVKEEKSNQLREAELREKALASDIRRVVSKLERALTKIDELDDQNMKLAKSVLSVENTVNLRHEKADGCKEKITSLDDKLKAVTAILEDELAKEKTLQRAKEKLQGELMRESEKMMEVERLFDEIEQGL